MGFTKIKTSVEDGIGIITLANPPLNILSRVVFEEIYMAMREMKANPQVRAVILTAEGANFAAGADINEIANVSDANVAEGTCLSAHKVADEIWKSSIPVIAAINGYCLGGGCEIVMACHIRIATDKARFGQPEINIGIIPGLGGTQRLPRYVGLPKAYEMLLAGDPISSQDAKTIGLVNFVVPETELLRQAKGLAKKIGAKSKATTALIMQAVREGIEKPLDDAMKLEANLFGKACATEDKKEGIKAFQEKRPPQFKDR